MQSMEPWIGRYFALIANGRTAEALDWLAQSPLPEESRDYHRRFIAILMEEADDPEFIETVTSSYVGLDHRDVVQMTAMLERYDDAFKFVRWRLENNWWVATLVLWGPGTDIRAQPAFADIMTEMGLVEFWDEFGWGDVCRRAEQDIVCDALSVDLSLLEGLEPRR